MSGVDLQAKLIHCLHRILIRFTQPLWAEYKKAHLVHETTARLDFVDQSILDAASSIGLVWLKDEEKAEFDADSK